MNKHLSALLLALLLTVNLLSGCGGEPPSAPPESAPEAPSAGEALPRETPAPPAPPEAPAQPEEAPEPAVPALSPAAAKPALAASRETPLPRAEDLPPFDGKASIPLNGGVPYFAPPEPTMAAFEQYAPRDRLNRCGQAVACVGTELMPTEERGEIGMVKPAGWHTVKYDCVDGKYLYNRCHLLGYQLTGENANEDNLITGTRYLNVEGMLPYENQIADYVHSTGNHVLYRVTPLYRGENLLCDGLVMEAQSLEDDGLQFCVWAFNAQPGITIDYATGDSRLTEAPAAPREEQPALPKPVPQEKPAPEPVPQPVPEPEPQGETYILNTNTRKFHRPSCSSVGDMKESNKAEFHGSREELIAQGYSPCKRCHP